MNTFVLTIKKEVSSQHYFLGAKLVSPIVFHSLQAGRWGENFVINMSTRMRFKLRPAVTNT
jgi:hypothetical protein